MTAFGRQVDQPPGMLQLKSVLLSRTISAISNVRYNEALTLLIVETLSRCYNRSRFSICDEILQLILHCQIYSILSLNPYIIEFMPDKFCISLKE